MKQNQIFIIAILFFFLACNRQTESVQTPPIETIPTETAPTETPVELPSTPSLVRVATGIPIFIGYTEKALTQGKTLKNIPFEITSLQEYEKHFGKGKANNASEPYGHYYLYESVIQFFAHGGQTCYILSVGEYSTPINPEELMSVMMNGNALEKEQRPDLIVVPDAIGLNVDECYLVYQSVLAYCNRMKFCMGIFDIHGGYREETMNADIEGFRSNIGKDFLRYGVAYYPWLKTGDNNLPTSGMVAGMIATASVWTGPIWLLVVVEIIFVVAMLFGYFWIAKAAQREKDD